MTLPILGESWDVEHGPPEARTAQSMNTHFTPRVLVYANGSLVVIQSCAVTEDGLPISGKSVASIALDQVTVEALTELILEMSEQFVEGVKRRDVREWLLPSQRELFRIARVRSWKVFYRGFPRSLSLGTDGARWRLSELKPHDEGGFVAGSEHSLTGFDPEDVSRRIMSILSIGSIMIERA